jgi:hypothetical protein
MGNSKYTGNFIYVNVYNRQSRRPALINEKAGLIDRPQRRDRQFQVSFCIMTAMRKLSFSPFSSSSWRNHKTTTTLATGIHRK